MAEVVRKIMDLYDLASNISDPRTKTLSLVQPVHMIVIVALYLTFIYKWGPQLMKNRPPFKIDKIVMIYNALQVFGCAYVFYRGCSMWIRSYKLFCQPVDRSLTPEAWEVIVISYYYYLLKVADLFDTVFFVLRKKNSHVSFLHVYHHTGMILLIGSAVHFVPGGHGSSVGIINSFVHCVMYSYYFVTLYKPEYKKNIWWKKYVTQLQIVQFCIYVIHVGSILFIPDCDYPKFTAFLFVPQNIFMLILFIDFYIKTYVKKRTEPTVSNNKVADEHETENNKETENDYVERLLNRSKENNILLRNVHRS